MTTGVTVSVAAGKGGTGKTLVTTSLAEALVSHVPEPVQVLDCDVEEPNAGLLLHPRILERRSVTVPVPVVDEELCTACGRCAQACQFSAIAVIRGTVVIFPEMCAGCGACAYACPKGAIREVERPVGELSRGMTESGIDFCAGQTIIGEERSGPVIKAVKGRGAPGALTLVDAPPGTACPMQETVRDTDFCILVTEPTPFGLSDLTAAVETCRELRVPCGVVVNRDRDGFGEIDRYCSDQGIPVLLRIAEQRVIAEAYSRGETLVRSFSQWIEPLNCMMDRIQEMLNGKEAEEMPRGDGTGPAGQGAGTGRGMGRGGGRGRMGGTAMGPGGSCVCPGCGHVAPHDRGVPCYQMNCPKCGQPMSRQR